jgi:D-3-phosphoglycerate dehydrogenase / 2-oxoglutarate reductase
MRILIADKLAPVVAGRLQDMGGTVSVEPALKDATLTARVAELDPEVLIVRSTKVTAADIAAGRSLALVIRAGTGVHTIDLPAASHRGVYVANCPGKNAIAVAELAIGLMISCDRRIPDNVAALRAHRWDKKTFGSARGLNGRTVAVLGVGTIGKAFITRAQALGMRVVAWSRSLSPEAAARLGVTLAPSPEAAVAGADVVSVHLALAPETRARIGESVFSQMSAGAIFLNTARGEVVDYGALQRAIVSRQLRVGLDVFPDEPSAAQGEYAHPLVDEPSVYGTHHIGASTDESEEAVGDECIRIVAAYRDGSPIPNCVNLAVRTPATHLLVVRHADRVGVLAHVLGVLREAGVNVEDMQNIVFSGGEAACARIATKGDVSATLLERIAADPNIFAASAVAISE